LIWIGVEKRFTQDKKMPQRLKKFYLKEIVPKPQTQSFVFEGFKVQERDEEDHNSKQ
jgi:hypothetical protein